MNQSDDSSRGKLFKAHDGTPAGRPAPAGHAVHGDMICWCIVGSEGQEIAAYGSEGVARSGWRALHSLANQAGAKLIRPDGSIADELVAYPPLSVVTSQGLQHDR